MIFNTMCPTVPMCLKNNLCRDGAGLNRIVLVPILYWRQPRNFFKNIPKSLGIGVAHIEHNFVHIFPTGFKAPFRRFYFYPLDVFHHRIVGGCFEAALKTPSP